MVRSVENIIDQLYGNDSNAVITEATFGAMDGIKGKEIFWDGIFLAAALMGFREMKMTKDEALILVKNGIKTLRKSKVYKS